MAGVFTQQRKMAAQQQKMHLSADGARASRSTTLSQSSTRKSPNRSRFFFFFFFGVVARMHVRCAPGGKEAELLNCFCWFAARCAVPKTMCQSSPA